MYGNNILSALFIFFYVKDYMSVHSYGNNILGAVFIFFYVKDIAIQICYSLELPG